MFPYYGCEGIVRLETSATGYTVDCFTPMYTGEATYSERLGQIGPNDEVPEWYKTKGFDAERR